MSLEVIGLSQILQLAYANDARQTTILRRKAYSARRKAAGQSTSTGGDFYLPFWTDVKRHVSGQADLQIATAGRIAKSKQTARLYNLLSQNFLDWWEEKRRQRNEAFTVMPDRIKARLSIEGIGTIKVENTLAITIGDDGHRVFYPYLCEEPELSEEAARLGLWVMSRAITEYSLIDMRILDVMRGRSFSSIDTPLLGNEEEILRIKYIEAINAWERIRKKYEG